MAIVAQEEHQLKDVEEDEWGLKCIEDCEIDS